MLHPSLRRPDRPRPEPGRQVHVVSEEEIRALDEPVTPGVPTHLNGLATRLRARISEHLASDAFEPPRPPDVALEVHRVSQDPRADAEALARLLHRDPFLAGAVLKLANSAAYGVAGRRISRLPEAVARVGLVPVRQVVLAAALHQLVCRGRHRERNLAAWRASVGAGMACRLLAPPYDTDPDRAFLLGLLHDIGEPVVIWEVERAAREGFAPADDLDAVLDHVVTALHPKVGAMVLLRWNLSENLARAVELHHVTPPPDKLRRFAALVRGGDRIWSLYEAGALDRRDGLAEAVADRHLRALELPPEALEHVLEVYPRSVEALLG